MTDAATVVRNELLAAVRAGDVPRVAAILDRHPALLNATDDRVQRIRSLTCWDITPIDYAE